MSGNIDRESPEPGNETPERPRTYSVPAAARELSLSPRTTWDLVWAGKLRAKRHGTRVIVPADAIDEYLASLPDYEPKATVHAA